MELITSVSNDKVKYARSLARKKERVAAEQFLVEGARLLEEASRVGIVPTLVFFERAAINSNARVRQLVIALQKQTREVHEVSATVMRALSDTETQQGIAAVLPLPKLPAKPDPQFTLVLDRVRDPGNLGTILRTAWAASVDSVLLAPETADPFNPKVVRAAVGAHFNVPIVVATWQEIEERLGNVRVYLADAQGELPYTQADWSPPCALIIGGEAEGVGDEARLIAADKISIPMPGNAESLNAAVAAAILMFEARRDKSP